MTKNLFDPNIVPACSYCVYGTAASDGKTILCPKKGIMTGDCSCRRFQYDPLKRQPKKPIRQIFQKEDFSI
ncbi:MAG TPA: hypothetical protein DEP43_05520 [Ruminococcaceae bacterium]|nr:hypothetical protein [Oscillospiraceae bacterium]MDD5920578.1 hypothetical protein [Oscillospiraceae bacterium]HAG56466.1 hypothetical protein [Oscillospiraceae bacterium]HAO69891.1 hypothetical protein [Oscillospiraceae bacterium]HCB65406.1 hypothetical protein [Oscillospiraceae bacterium]